MPSPPQRRNGKKILRTCAWLALILLLTVTTMLIFEEKFIFFPERYPSGDWEAPARDHVPAEDVFIPTPDGAQLHGWYIPTPDRKTTLLYFHGNAGNITHRWDWAKQLRTLKINVLLFDYRGYGKSTGTPSEKSLYEDAEHVYNFLIKEKNLQPQHLILYGESLGSAPACYLASLYSVRALILRSPFTNARDMASKIFPIPLVSRLIRSRLPNDEYIKQARCPVLIIHAEDDHVVPFKQGERLFRLAPEPKEFLRFPDGDHNTLEEKHGEVLIREIYKFLEKTSTH
jgi:fermentation-respiration switch protein FrsA (DUF1100 family)